MVTDNAPLWIIAEILTKDTPEEKAKVLSDYRAQQLERWEWINKGAVERSQRTLKRRAEWRDLPWWKRLFRSEPW